MAGPWWRCDISSCGWESCGPPDCSPRCKVNFHEFGVDLCGRSVSQIRNELQLASSWQQFNMLLQVTAGPKVQSFTCRLTLEVTTGSDFFADVGCTPDGFDSGLFRHRQYTNNFLLQNMLLEKGLAWKSHQHMNESGVFYAVHLRAMEKRQSNSTNSTFTWVNFTTHHRNWECRNTWGCDLPRRKAPAQVVIEWNVKIASSDPHSQPWQVPEKIQIPCLVEMQEHRVVLVFKGNSTYPLRGMIPKISKYSSFRWTSDFVGTYVGGLPSVWSREVQAKYHMPREDLLDWRARQNLTSGKPEGVMLRIAAGPTPGSLELSILPQAGGPSTEGKFCFIPADGFHIYQQLCSEYFPIRAQASACAAMEAAEATAKTVVPAAMLFSLLVVFTYACWLQFILTTFSVQEKRWVDASNWTLI